MHELSIAMDIVEIAAAESRRRDDVGVKAVHLRLGPLSGVVKEALASAYELAREEEPCLAESVLIVEEVPIVAFCSSCQATTEVESIQLLCCRRCGSPVDEILRGRELEVSAMEILE